MFFVYYDSGTCNYGDHSSGLEKYETMEKAMQFIINYRMNHFDPTITIIQGDELEMYCSSFNPSEMIEGEIPKCELTITPDKV